MACSYTLAVEFLAEVRTEGVGTFLRQAGLLRGFRQAGSADRGYVVPPADSVRGWLVRLDGHVAEFVFAMGADADGE